MIKLYAMRNRGYSFIKGECVMSSKKEVLSPRNHEEWIELCTWVEINIFDFDGKTQKLQKQTCLVLDGLRKGQEVANNDNDTYGEYPLNVILMTFKANKIQIKNAIKNKEFDSDKNKMLYVCAIVRDKLNDMYTRYLKTQKVKEKVEMFDTSIMTNEGAEYQTTTRKNNKRLDGLW